jgi:hypothetical protein
LTGIRSGRIRIEVELVDDLHLGCRDDVGVVDTLGLQPVMRQVIEQQHDDQ